MPTVAILRTDSPGVEAGRITEVNETALLLPSDICTRVPCDRALLGYEWRLRVAQAHDTLSDLRSHLRLLSHLYIFKDRFIRGQRHNTRARSVLTNVEQKIQVDAARYRKSRAALAVLAPVLRKEDKDWAVELRPLHNDDIRRMTEAREDESEGNRTLSWIWKTRGVADPDDTEATHECKHIYVISYAVFAYRNVALRIEWCKARARANRWREECQLIEEEMRRVQQFHEWQANTWTARARTFVETSAEHAEGLQAYACRQAEIRQTMRNACAWHWRGVPLWLTLGLPDIDTTPQERAVEVE